MPTSKTEVSRRRFALVAGTLAAGRIPLRGASEDAGAATIINSGSTNLPGFRIVVGRSGVAEFTSIPRRRGAQKAQPATTRRTLPRALVETFYSDLAAAKPLDSLPAVHCPKSASFGSTLTVAFGKEQTPDLSCGDGGSAMMRDLIRDARQIVAIIQAAESGPERRPLC